MDYSIWAFLLLAVGVTLLVAEVFIPSGGVISVLSTLSLLGALVCAWHAWWSTSQATFWGFVGGTAFLLPVVVAVAFYIWPNTPLGRRAILEAPAPHEVASFVEQEEKHRQMVGKTGETVTALNPAGLARIDGHRVHCQSEGVILDAGTPIRVIAARANSVIVRRLDPNAPAAEPSSGSLRRSADDQPLDFDLS
ncbi:MAG TPA: NfeD family protein [Planctomycetaceae bacterium]|nr:NfeD family protein [Planctomycetaceae bacterium]